LAPLPTVPKHLTDPDVDPDANVFKVRFEAPVIVELKVIN
jgi:hypothetical protein